MPQYNEQEIHELKEIADRKINEAIKEFNSKTGYVLIVECNQTTSQTICGLITGYNYKSEARKSIY